MKIFFEGLELETIIGLWDWERKEKRIILCDCMVEFDYQKSDAIEDTINYADLAISFRKIAQDQSYYLLERLLEDLKTFMHENIPQLLAYQIKLTKVDVLEHAKCCGVEDTWSKSNKHSI